MKHLRLFAQEELVLALRSRWTQIFAVVFGVLSFAVAGAGYVLSGGHGVQDFARTAVSLVQLVLLLVPLTALLIGVLSLAPDRGAAELLFSQPVSRRTILLGKLLGLFQALAAAQAVGFGAAGAVVYGQSGSEGLGGFLLLVAASLVTTAVFLGLAALLSAGAVGRKRTRALALALVVWFVAVVLFDLAALGLASLLPSGTASRVLMVSTIVNPIGAVRTGTLLGIEGTGAFGAASLALFRFTRGTWGAGLVLGLSLLFWLVAPTALAVRRLRRADVWHAARVAAPWNVGVSLVYNCRQITEEARVRGGDRLPRLDRQEALGFPLRAAVACLSGAAAARARGGGAFRWGGLRRRGRFPRGSAAAWPWPWAWWWRRSCSSAGPRSRSPPGSS